MELRPAQGPGRARWTSGARLVKAGRKGRRACGRARVLRPPQRRGRAVWTRGARRGTDGREGGRACGSAFAMSGAVPMRILPLFLLLTLAACATTAPAPTLGERAASLWGDVSTLAADDMEGRQTGSPGYQRAADHVVARFREIGLQPAGTDGWFQPILFEEQFVVADRSSAELVEN